MQPSASRCRAAQSPWPATAAQGRAGESAESCRPDRLRCGSGCHAPCGLRSGAETRHAPAQATATRACAPTPSSGSAPLLRRRHAQIRGSARACGGPLRSRPVPLPPRAQAVGPGRLTRHNVPDGRGTCALQSCRAARRRARAQVFSRPQDRCPQGCTCRCERARAGPQRSGPQRRSLNSGRIYSAASGWSGRWRSPPQGLTGNTVRAAAPPCARVAPSTKSRRASAHP